jgi:hypothetical protein
VGGRKKLKKQDTKISALFTKKKFFNGQAM